MHDREKGLIAAIQILAALNSTDYFISGGYNSYANSIQQISALNIFAKLSFREIIKTPELQITEPTNIYVVTITELCFGILFLGVLITSKRYRSMVKTLETSRKKRKENELGEFNQALENARIHRDQAVKDIVNNSEFSATLALPGYTGLYFPGYRKKEYGLDFKLDKFITKGGKGQISLGTVLKPDYYITQEDMSKKYIIKESLKPI